MKTRALFFVLFALLALPLAAVEVPAPAPVIPETPQADSGPEPARGPAEIGGPAEGGAICPADLDLTRGSLQFSRERQEATGCIFLCGLFNQSCNDLCGFGNVDHFSCLRFGGPVDCLCKGGRGFFVEC